MRAYFEPGVATPTGTLFVMPGRADRDPLHKLQKVQRVHSKLGADARPLLAAAGRVAQSDACPQSFTEFDLRTLVPPVEARRSAPRRDPAHPPAALRRARRPGAVPRGAAPKDAWAQCW